MKNAFTLIELLLVIVIIGISAAVALPSFAGRLEKLRGREAEITLLLINNAQKRYRLVMGNYYFCPSPCSKQALNENLTLALPNEGFFDYSIEPRGTTGFQANATRLDGNCEGKNMTSTDINSTLTKRCSQW